MTARDVQEMNDVHAGKPSGAWVLDNPDRGAFCSILAVEYGDTPYQVSQAMPMTRCHGRCRG